MGPRECGPRHPRAKAAGALPLAPCLRVLWGFWESLSGLEEVALGMMGPTGSQRQTASGHVGLGEAGFPGLPQPLCLGPPEVEREDSGPRIPGGPGTHPGDAVLPLPPQVRCCSAGAPGLSLAEACSPASWRTTSSWTSSEPRHPIKFQHNTAPRLHVTDIPRTGQEEMGRHLCPCSRFNSP